MQQPSKNNFSGLVAVVKVHPDQPDEVLFKAVCACNGDRAQQLADALNDCEELSLQVIWDQALRVGYGCDNCLVVQRRDDNMTKSPVKLPASYWNDVLFSRGGWNPREQDGRSHYFECLGLTEQVLTLSDKEKPLTLPTR